MTGKPSLPDENSPARPAFDAAVHRFQLFIASNLARSLDKNVDARQAGSALLQDFTEAMNEARLGLSEHTSPSEADRLTRAAYREASNLVARSLASDELGHVDPALEKAVIFHLRSFETVLAAFDAGTQHAAAEAVRRAQGADKGKKR